MTPGVDTEAISESVEIGMDNLFRFGWQNAMKTILLALLLLVVCVLVRRMILKVVDTLLDRGGHIDRTFHKFIRSTANILLWFVTILIVAGSLGIDASSLLALLGIAGLAISLSIQGSLSNLAGGLIILSTHPFKVRDYVKIGDMEGHICEISLVHTKLNTLDHRRVILPNSSVVESQIINYSTEELRRVDLVLSADYNASVEQVKGVLMEIMERHDKVLSDPAPFARLSNYGDSAIEYTIRAWCRNEDYWTVHFDLLEAAKTAFDAADIGIPYPQVEVTLKK